MNGNVNTFRGWRWLTLALALVSASVSALAQGTIVHVQLSTPNPNPEFPWDFEGMRLMGLFPQSYNLDFNNDGTPEYVIRASGPSSTAGFGIYGEGMNSVWAHRPFDSSFVVAMNYGDQIGPNLMSSTFSWEENSNGLGSKFSASVDIFTAGYFAGLDSAYAGLQFQLNGETHYGWIRVGAPLAFFNGGWIYEYAYETRPDTPIFAGAVPEPSTWALFGVGTFALAMFRKRKPGL